jgi:hypothetical protein
MQIHNADLHGHGFVLQFLFSDDTPFDGQMRWPVDITYNYYLNFIFRHFFLKKQLYDIFCIDS